MQPATESENANTHHHNDIKRYCYSTADVLIIGNRLYILEMPANHRQAFEQQCCFTQFVIVQRHLVLIRIFGNDEKFSNRRQQFVGQPLEMRTEIILDFVPQWRPIEV